MQQMTKRRKKKVMRTSHYTYPVRLSQEQRIFLAMMTHTSRISAKHDLVARTLLMSGQSQGEPGSTDGQKALALSISRRTVIRIKQRFVQENLEVALKRDNPIPLSESTAPGAEKDFLVPGGSPLDRLRRRFCKSLAGHQKAVVNQHPLGESSPWPA